MVVSLLAEGEWAWSVALLPFWPPMWSATAASFGGNEVTVMFPAGTEEIEIIGTFAIPEFGTIAALILAVAIISIIAVSAKTRLSVMPKF